MLPSPPQVLPIVLLGHRAPHLCALHVGNVPRPCQVEPVGLVQLGAYQKVEVGDAFVFPDEGGREPQLAVGLDDADHLCRWRAMRRAVEEKGSDVGMDEYHKNHEYINARQSTWRV